MCKINSMSRRSSDPQVNLINDLEDEKKHILNEKLSDQWSVCCSKTDRHALKYFVQVGMGITVMVFAMASICVSEPEADNSVYFGLLSGTLGYFLEAPKLTVD